MAITQQNKFSLQVLIDLQLLNCSKKPATDYTPCHISGAGDNLVVVKEATA